MRISDWSSDVCSSDLGTLPIDSARVVDDESALHWDWRCDVLVVGFGPAGASAEIAAHESGAKTLIVERFDGGGATDLSGGLVYGGRGPEPQRRADVHDSPDAMYRCLHMQNAAAVSAAHRKSAGNGESGSVRVEVGG